MEPEADHLIKAAIEYIRFVHGEGSYYGAQYDDSYPALESAVRSYLRKHPLNPEWLPQYTF